MEQQKHLDAAVLEVAFNSVMHSYLRFLSNIANSIFEGSQDVRREKRKLCAVKKDMFEFLVAHENIYKLKAIRLKFEKGSVIVENTIIYLDNCEHVLKTDDVFKYVAGDVNSEVCYNVKEVKEEIVKTLTYSHEKLNITNKNILQYTDNSYLFYKNDLKNNCSDYKELKLYIDTRAKSYINEEVSILHIEKITFNFKGSVKDFEDEKSCGVCLEDQEVCHLPCNHFYCRNCTEKMFAIPKDGSKAIFQCPICRDDCT